MDSNGVKKETREITKHIPVLLEEVLEGLCLDQGKSVVDATLGGGGHTRAILQKIVPSGKLLSLDQDRVAIDSFLAQCQEDVFLKKALDEKNLTVHKANFSEVSRISKEEGFISVDAIMADLGYSSDQIEDGSRGLSFQQDGPLDMRLDSDTELTARDIVNTYDSRELMRIFRDYGEEEYAHSLAEAIVTARNIKPIETTHDLRRVIEEVTPKGKLHTQKIHPATKVFQALRIVVNDEYRRLEEFLQGSIDVLAPGGRLAIIAFHSGEDRIVKEFFQEQAKGCVCPKEFPICICHKKPKVKILTKKVIIAGEQELVHNPRARSAKLRIVEKVG